MTNPTPKDNPRAWSPQKTEILAGQMRRADCLLSLQLYGEQAKSPWIPREALEVLREVYRVRLKELRESGSP